MKKVISIIILVIGAIFICEAKQMKEKPRVIVMTDDPAPVYIQAWGGGNTAARAFYKLKQQYPDQYEEAISKVVMYNIWYQDEAGPYIEHYHPKVTMIYSAFFKGSWDYNSMPETKRYAYYA